jgi:hypothetical protein
MMDLRPAIRLLALFAARKALSDAKAYVADHPELLREAEHQLRRAPWRSADCQTMAS